MRILLDESRPRRMGGELSGHSVTTVTDMGWSGVKNGELLRLAADRFDVFLTADQNLQYQQNLAALPVSVVILVAQSNRLEALRPLVPALLTCLTTLSPRSLARVGG